MRNSAQLNKDKTPELSWGADSPCPIAKHILILSAVQQPHEVNAYLNLPFTQVHNAAQGRRVNYSTSYKEPWAAQGTDFLRPVTHSHH